MAPAARSRPRAGGHARPRRDAPLRGRALRDVDVVEDAYVLCDDGAIEAVGRDARARRALDRRRRGARRARPLRRSRASSTATRIRRWGGDRVEEFSLRAGGASYEELHAGGRRHPLDRRARRARSARTACARASSAHAAWMLAPRHDDVGGQVGLRPRPRHRARVAARDPRRRRLADVARRARGAARARRRRRVPRLRARRGAAGGRAARGRRRRLPRARRVRRGAGAPLPRGVPRRRPRAAAARRPVHRERRDPARGRARRALGRPPRGDRRRPASRALAASDVVGVLLPASALFLDRPMPPARALVDAGAAIALATDFNPGSAFTTSLPLVCSLACTQLQLSPGGGARRRHRQRGARARPRARPRADRARAARRPRARSTRPTGATSPTTSPATSSPRVVQDGTVALPALSWRRCRRASSAAAARSRSGTSTSTCSIDDEGNEVADSGTSCATPRRTREATGPASARARRRSRRGAAAAKSSAAARSRAAGPAASWTARRRGGADASRR